MGIENQLEQFGHWKDHLQHVVHDYQEWLDDTGFSDTEIEFQIIEMLRLIEKETMSVAFVAEFSRGKTELINALFFSSYGVRLLPSKPGRTTMCPTELFFDSKQAPYIRLLDIDTRLDERSLDELKGAPHQWVHMELDTDDVEQLQQSFSEVLKTKTVSSSRAKELGFAIDNDDIDVEIPAWRHALISFPHPLLEKGLTVIDTPGLNAIGSEPELTLKLLPSAQAMIFLLASDTGVTESDMAMWNQYIQPYKTEHPNGLAVVLNKVDTLFDELSTEAEIKQSLKKQKNETARLLNIDEQQVFPLSAKQALIGKIKKQSDVTKQSGIDVFETHVAEQILANQTDILNQHITSKLDESIGGFQAALQHRIDATQKSLSEFEAIQNKSQETTMELLNVTRKEQTIYNANIKHLKTSRHVFRTQVKDLLHVVSHDRVEDIISRSQKVMLSSWTSMGIRQGMQQAFDELGALLIETLTVSTRSARLLDSIYTKFKNEHGIEVQHRPKLEIESYQRRLKRLLNQGIEFSNSPVAALTEQNALTRRFVKTVGLKTHAIFEHLNQDIQAWEKEGLSPLIREVNEQKKQVEKKLESLRAVFDSKEKVENTIKHYQKTLDELTFQLGSLSKIAQRLEQPTQIPEPVLKVVQG